MKVHVGGYGFQGIASLEHINGLVGKGEVILNGLAGYYAVIAETLGEDEGMSRLSEFVKRLFNTLKVMDGFAVSKPLGLRHKLQKLRHCRIWSRQNHVFESNVRDSFLEGISGITVFSAEVFDLEERAVRLLSGTARGVAASCISLPGLFPPYMGRYVTTTYLSQIPVSFLSNGDIVLLNLRDPSYGRLKTASDLLFHSMEVRSLSYAREMLSHSECRLVRVAKIVCSDNVLDFLERLRKGS
ncbi:MAG TPA: hypothetical protein ENN47_04860 [Mesotoga infera]|uniref:Uncharacterized protein n=1 Tax=Mesotoga infera TaxID=1236046 RepID=A0A7C1CYA4_9BACT|nr:hypothetical protein [Mesotoga infera]